MDFQQNHEKGESIASGTRRRYGTVRPFVAIATVVLCLATGLGRSFGQNGPASIVGFTAEQVTALFGKPSLQQPEMDGVTIWYYDGTAKGTTTIYFAGGRVVRMTPDGMIEELQRRANGQTEEQIPTECPHDPAAVMSTDHICVAEYELRNAEVAPPGSPQQRQRFQAAARRYREAVRVANTSAEKGLANFAMERLVHVYGADGLGDLAEAEAILLQLVKVARAEDLIAIMPRAFVELRTLDTRSRDLETAIDALRDRAVLEPYSAEAQNFVATYYWDRVLRSLQLNQLDASTRESYVSRGLSAIDRAIALRPNYAEALVFKSLLIRLQAIMETNPQKQEDLVTQANSFAQRAKELTSTK